VAEPLVSVVVPARRLTDVGRRCFEHLLALPQPVEILFVPDEPEEVDPRVTCVPSGPATIGEKRQLGLDRARGPFIALLDDDAYPHPSWLEQAVAAFADPGVGAVTGPTLTPPDDHRLARLGGRVYESRLVSGTQRWRYVPLEPRDVEEGTGVNTIFRREDALAIRFDTIQMPGDDTVLGDRMRARGRRIRYVPGAIAFHTRRRLWRAHLLQLFRYSVQRGRFARQIGGASRQPAYFAPSALLLWTLLGWIPPAVRPFWAGSLGLYAAVCLVAGRSRRPGDWLRVSAGIVATHYTYGVGVLLGLCSRRLPQERAASDPVESSASSR
jgi:cellulose synthase/poly-beta-1,6-N-acetylglucosamine synthase-like glycosyltransferase